jgi:hypothetical protein
MNDDRAAIRLRTASVHEERAARHMQAAVRWRDEGEVQRAVLEVRYAMVERRLAELERDRRRLESGPAGRLPAANRPARGHATTVKGAVEVVYDGDRWHVLVDGDTDASSTHEFRIAAVVVAHETARCAGRDLVVRGRDGAPREHVRYGSDPRRPPVTYRQPELRRV